MKWAQQGPYSRLEGESSSSRGAGNVQPSYELGLMRNDRGSSSVGKRVVVEEVDEIRTYTLDMK